MAVSQVERLKNPSKVTTWNSFVASQPPSSALEGIGYSGLSVLLRIRKWTRRSGGDLSLAAPQQPVRRVLEATGLIHVFAVYPSVEEAASDVRHAEAWSPTVP